MLLLPTRTVVAVVGGGGGAAAGMQFGLFSDAVRRAFLKGDNLKYSEGMG